MRVDRLRNLAVIDPDTACRIGIVTDYWIDAATARVAELMIRPVDVDLSQRVDTSRVARVGRDAVVLTPADCARTGVRPVPDRWLNRRHLRDLTVYTDAGNRLGRVAGAVIDPTTLAVETYELGIPLWRRWLPGLKRITADRVAWCGHDVLVVRTDDPAKLRPAGHEDDFGYEVTANALVDGLSAPGAIR